MSMLESNQMKCANYDCTNHLTKFELSRLGKYWSKYRLCLDCRWHKKAIRVRCPRCSKPFCQLNNSLFCNNCKVKKIVKLNTRECSECGTSFKPTRKKMTCSKKCAKIRKSKRDKENGLRWIREKRGVFQKYAKVLMDNGWKVIPPKEESK